MTVKNITKEGFHQAINSGRPALIEFYAPWCVYCRRIAPALEEIAREYGDRLLVGQVNIDDCPELAEEYRVEVVPTLILFKEGVPAGDLVAPESGAQIEALIEAAPSEGEEQGDIYDMIIIGGGPGGYTAALYAARAGLSTLVLEKLSAGGQMCQTTQIDNYPGFEHGIDGMELGQKMRAGAERFGAVTVMAEVLSAELSGEIKRIETSEGVFLGRTVTVATGAEHRHLGLEREEEFIGRGVGYCAACDGMFYRGKTVAVVGGGNSAAADAMLLSRICKKVIIIHRRDTLRATRVYHEPLMKAENVEFRWNSTVEELLGQDRLTGARLRDVKTGEETVLELEGLFISVGRSPATALFREQLAVDGSGYIIADESTRTSLPGVFAVGDVRTKAVRQVITAAADGAAAAHQAEEYLAGGGQHG